MTSFAYNITVTFRRSGHFGQGGYVAHWCELWFSFAQTAGAAVQGLATEWW
jgi:hypothetical protein